MPGRTLQNPYQLRGPVSAADRDPGGTAGSGGSGRSPVEQATLRRLNRAFAGFFGRVLA